jgi:hypothetical protein
MVSRMMEMMPDRQMNKDTKANNLELRKMGNLKACNVTAFHHHFPLTETIAEAGECTL